MTDSHRYYLKLATWVVQRQADEPSPRQLRSSAAVAHLARDLVQSLDDDKEHFWVILLDRKLHYRMHTLLSMGSQTNTVIHPREVFGPALREGAVSVLLVHNYPSGSAAPSDADFAITQRLVDIGLIVGIEVIDHVIIGNGTWNYHSMKDQGYCVGSGKVIEVEKP